MTDLSFRKSLFLFSIVLIILELIIYKDFIFGDYHFLYKDLGDDSYVSSYPSLYAKIESLKLGEIPSWSFNNALGENLYPFWLEPIALFIALMFFKNDVASSFIWIQITYSFLAGVFFFSFLRGFKIHYLSAVVMSCLFVFSGFMILHSTWMNLIFSNTVMLFSFLIFAWQRFILNKQWFYFPISVAFLAIGNPVNIYFATLLIIILMLLQIESTYKQVWRKWLTATYQLILMGIIGVGLGGFMLLSNLSIMLNSPRGTGAYSNPTKESITNSFQFASFTELKTSFLRLFSPNLEGITDNYSGWFNYFEAPIWYVGLIVLLLLPQLFHFINKKEKIIYGMVILFFLVITLLPKFRLLVWFNSGNYYREISFLFSIVALLYTAEALGYIIREKRVFLKTLFITLGSIILLLILIFGQISIDSSPSLFTIIFFLVVYTGLIWFWNKQNMKSLYFLGGFILLEIIIFTAPTLGDRKIITENDTKTGNGYKDATIDAIADIKDDNFYRLEKDYFSGVSRDATFNEAKIQGFYDSRSYYSFHNINYINFLNCIGELGTNNETATRWVNGISGSTNVMRICNVKYFLTKTDNIEKYNNDFFLINENRDVKTLALKSSIPFGFTYDNYIDYKKFVDLNKSEKQNLILNTVVLDKKLLPYKDFLNQYDIIKTLTNSQRDTLTNIKFGYNTISGKIDSKKSQFLFFSIPFDDGWSLKINGQSHKLNLAFNGLMGAFIDAGSKTIKLEFKDSKKEKGIIISLVSLLIFLSALIYTAFKNKRFITQKED